jgi:uncharacterized protein (TIGR01777 family)
MTQSRVVPTRTLAEAAAKCGSPPAVWVQMSTLAIYGDAGDAVLDETAPAADAPPQMAGVANAWESAAAGAPCDRQVVLRTGLVLDRDTPAFNRLSGLVKWGLGGRIGTGRQWVSWMHVDDFLAAVRHVVDDPRLSGVFHLTSPEPVTNAQLMAAFRTALHRPVAPPTPAPLVRWGAALLRTDPALALTGRRCVPGRLTAAGFTFSQPRIDAALADLMR